MKCPKCGNEMIRVPGKLVYFCEGCDQCFDKIEIITAEEKAKKSSLRRNIK